MDFEGHGNVADVNSIWAPAFNGCFIVFQM